MTKLGGGELGVRGMSRNLGEWLSNTMRLSGDYFEAYRLMHLAALAIRRLARNQFCQLELTLIAIEFGFSDVEFLLTNLLNRCLSVSFVLESGERVDANLPELLQNRGKSISDDD